MWVVTTDEEANFIFDLQADRDHWPAVPQERCRAHQRWRVPGHGGDDSSGRRGARARGAVPAHLLPPGRMDMGGLHRPAAPEACAESEGLVRREIITTAAHIQAAGAAARSD